MKRVLAVLVCVGGLMALTGCHKMAFFGFGGVQGSGVAKTERRKTGDFKGLDVGGAFRVEVTCLKETGLTLTADDNLLQYIKTEVHNGVLHVDMDGRPVSFKTNPKLIVTVPDLDNFNISGASEVTVANLKTQDVDVNLSGASHLNVTGTAASIKADVSGASEFNGKDLQASSVEVNASGASSAEVFASTDLQAEASGASKVYYYGNPQSVSPKANGAGKIRAGA